MASSNVTEVQAIQYINPSAHTCSKWYMRPCALMDILSHRKSPLQVRSASSVKVLWGGRDRGGGGDAGATWVGWGGRVQ